MIFQIRFLTQGICYCIELTFKENKNCNCTLAKWLSPSLTRGVVGNIRWGLMTSEPWSRLYRLLITSIKSDVFFTGKNRLLGTFIPGI